MLVHTELALDDHAWSGFSSPVGHAEKDEKILPLLFRIPGDDTEDLHNMATLLKMVSEKPPTEEDLNDPRRLEAITQLEQMDAMKKEIMVHSDRRYIALRQWSVRHTENGPTSPLVLEWLLNPVPPKGLKLEESRHPKYQIRYKFGWYSLNEISLWQRGIGPVVQIGENP